MYITSPLTPQIVLKSPQNNKPYYVIKSCRLVVNSLDKSIKGTDLLIIMQRDHVYSVCGGR